MKKSELRNIIREQIKKMVEPKRDSVKTGGEIQLIPVTKQMGPQEPSRWGAGSGALNGWVCTNAPFPIGTGIGCYESTGGIYTNTSTGQSYNLPCIPVGYPNGSCFQYKHSNQGTPACEAHCLHS